VYAFHWLLILGLATIGLVGAGIATVAFVRGRRSTGWPRTSGVIVESRLRSDVDYGTPTPEVSYEYEVDGITHTGTVISYKIERLTKKCAIETAEIYHEGKIVDVYFDPAKPAVSVLEPGGENATAPVLAVMAGCGAFGTALWCVLAPE
jgi:hypothetical protein